MISAQYSNYITKVYFLKLNYFKMKCISQKDSWFVEMRYKNNTAYVTFQAHSIWRQCFHLRNCQSMSLCQMYAMILEMNRHLKMYVRMYV